MAKGRTQGGHGGLGGVSPAGGGGPEGAWGTGLEGLGCPARTGRKHCGPPAARAVPGAEGPREDDPAVDGRGPGCWAPRRRLAGAEGSAVREELRWLGPRAPSQWTHGLLSVPGHGAQAGLPTAVTLWARGSTFMGQPDTPATAALADTASATARALRAVGPKPPRPLWPRQPRVAFRTELLTRSPSADGSSTSASAASALGGAALGAWPALAHAEGAWLCGAARWPGGEAAGRAGLIARAAAWRPPPSGSGRRCRARPPASGRGSRGRCWPRTSGRRSGGERGR